MINDPKHLTEVDNRYIQAVFDNWKNKNILLEGAKVIEMTLESFGFIAKVVEINPSSDENHFITQLRGKTTYAAIHKLRKDLALSLASPTGDVSVVATGNPVLVDICVPRFKEAGHDIPQEFNYECKPIGRFRRWLAVRHLRNSRHYYQKALEVRKQIEYLIRIKELRKKPHF